MKKILCLFTVILLALGTQAQTTTFPIDETTKKITYSEVVPLEGVSKSEIFERSKNLGISGKNTIKEDANEGVYVYKGQINVKYPAPQVGNFHTGVVSYVVTIGSKDGKYKYVITDFVHTSDKANGGKLDGSLPECGKYTLTLAGWGTIKKQTMEEMDKFIAGLKSKMSGGKTGTLGKDW
jgi:hypothetical protein